MGFSKVSLCLYNKWRIFDQWKLSNLSTKLSMEWNSMCLPFWILFDQWNLSTMQSKCTIFARSMCLQFWLLWQWLYMFSMSLNLWNMHEFFSKRMFDMRKCFLHIIINTVHFKCMRFRIFL